MVLEYGSTGMILEYDAIGPGTVLATAYEDPNMTVHMMDHMMDAHSSLDMMDRARWQR